MYPWRFIISWQVGLLLAGATVLSLTGIWSLAEGMSDGQIETAVPTMGSSIRDASEYGRGWVRARNLGIIDSVPRSGTPTASPEPSSPTPTSTPEPRPTDAPEPVSVPPEERDTVCKGYSWPCEEALKVKWCESGHSWNKVSPYGDYGGFQINQIHASKFPEFWTRWMDPAYNTYMAYTIWSQQGWRPWGCRYAIYN